ncbi:hypothetical protein BASA50_010576 [Batrachochytrium salamandrivorans]|uniref:Thioredoxin domain-containing protein n=1 Tax=Batrachochytrium salamandrivorans TaxID=1357716 RepID=A0ABQ8EYP9_9FUNG|nr:hypothetical protein BASA60_008736 [Batrachochytrium salamandrivorans]KAH6572617.1 hypothetical protein BASA62_003296 [Batrachochytrium salamandrivorans]KAH6585646.1 hypothetical protein BASA61_006763 [Batrachochytrium salamandrivorans]KAH6588705.1 hypothetical protein BASA50_010576 [Batrachochytrium salamandrivorans]
MLACNPQCRALLWLCFVWILAFVALAHAHDSPESSGQNQMNGGVGGAVPKKRFLTMAEVEAQAAEAEHFVTYVQPADFQTYLGRKGYRFVFFGASWCKHCKRLTPKWLKLQTRIAKEQPFRHVDFQMVKIDCSNEEGHGAEAYPTILFYRAGALVEEYAGELKVRDMLNYLVDMTREFKTSSENQTQAPPLHNEL